MKKYILLVAIALTTLSLSAQKNKKYIQTRDCYVSTFAEKFSLDEAQQASLTEAFNKKSKTSNLLKKEVESGTLSNEEKQAKMKVVNTEYYNLLKKLSGKSVKEVKSIDKEIRSKCVKK